MEKLIFPKEPLPFGNTLRSNPLPNGSGGMSARSMGKRQGERHPQNTQKHSRRSWISLFIPSFDCSFFQLPAKRKHLLPARIDALPAIPAIGGCSFALLR